MGNLGNKKHHREMVIKESYSSLFMYFSIKYDNSYLVINKSLCLS